MDCETIVKVKIYEAIRQVSSCYWNVDNSKIAQGINEYIRDVFNFDKKIYKYPSIDIEETIKLINIYLKECKATVDYLEKVSNICKNALKKSKIREQKKLEEEKEDNDEDDSIDED